ncbi:nuclear receptor 2C2-associated protein isoform X2 [Pongo abelii]|uniref:NR2C2AP isoform 7 n=1 Tax=Pongo abelii TaxID=9601 RepID=A0A2J8T5G3_PONAB|nr:NR2C2AP isoform 7 [Pongo abelii]
MTHSLVCPETVSRVSSVLNRNTRQFGKKHLFDQDEETCWNSDQGPSQWVTLEFPQLICVSQLQIQFQGGFSSRRGCLEGSQGTQALRKIVDFYPEDNNSLQISCPCFWDRWSVPLEALDSPKPEWEGTLMCDLEHLLKWTG